MLSWCLISSGASCGKTSAGSRDVAECGLWGPLLVMAVAKDIITNVLRSSLLRFIKDASGDQCPGDGDEHVTSFISDFLGFLCWLPGNKLQFFCQRCFVFNYTDSKTDLTFDWLLSITGCTCAICSPAQLSWVPMSHWQSQRFSRHWCKPFVDSELSIQKMQGF